MVGVPNYDGSFIFNRSPLTFVMVGVNATEIMTMSLDYDEIFVGRW